MKKTTINTEAMKIAEIIRNSDTWDMDACAELCELAGMEDDWKAADGETFEQVVFAAAEKLGVEIIAETPSEHVEVRVDDWETGSGWSGGDSCEYDYDPEHQHSRDDLVDFVDDQLRLLLDGCRSREERMQRLKAYADDSISDARYVMTVYAAHDDDDDDDYYNDYSDDEPIAEYRVWLSDVAKDMLEAEKDD